MAWDADELTQDEESELIDLERALTLREALILISLEHGTYNATAIGTSLAAAMSSVSTPEQRLKAMRLVDETNGALHPTPKGSAAVRWFVKTLDAITHV